MFWPIVYFGFQLYALIMILSIFILQDNFYFYIDRKLFFRYWYTVGIANCLCRIFFD